MSKVKLNNDPYTVTSTALENGKGSDNSANACTEKAEEIRPSDIPYDEYMKVVHENEVLKHIIVELNKQLYGGEYDK